MAGMSGNSHINLLAKLRRKVAAWRRRPWAEKRWFFPAIALLGLARLAVLTVPFKRIAPWLGKDLDVTKEGDKNVVRFSYNKEIHLAGPAYLVMKYVGEVK